MAIGSTKIEPKDPKTLAPMEAALETSAKLADEEKDQIAKRAEVLQTVIRDIEKLLVDNEVTTKEFGDMVDFLNRMTSMVFEKLTLTEIKRRIKE